MDDRKRNRRGTPAVEEAMNPERLKLIVSYTVDDRRRASEPEHPHRRQGDTPSLDRQKRADE